MNELLSLDRLARRLRVPAKWLREQAVAGRIPCLRAGSRYLFNATAVEDCLAKQAASPEGSAPNIPSAATNKHKDRRS